MKNLLGKKVIITSDNDNYDNYRDKTLVITHVATNKSGHPGYDEAMGGMALCDLEDTDGNEIPFSLYEYEFKVL